MFITLEGIEGSGKTTQIGSIAEYLKKKGHDVVITREPGATSTGIKIRSILLDPENRDISPVCELLLYGADRAQHISEVILPALRDGKTVICDRFTDATAAYQGEARGLDRELISDIEKIAAKGVKPDLTILFDLEPEIGLERSFAALGSGERTIDESRFEQEHLDFHRKVRRGYLNLAERESDRFLIVDASMSREEVLHQILSNERFNMLSDIAVN